MSAVQINAPAPVMPARFQQQHWAAFTGAPFFAQGPFGRRPANWAESHRIPAQGQKLPADVLTRQEVRAVCQDAAKPVLHGYICAMAWGLQGASWTGAHVVVAWERRAEIELSGVGVIRPPGVGI